MSHRHMEIPKAKTKQITVKGEGTLTSTPLSIRKHLNPRTPAFTKLLR